MADNMRTQRQCDSTLLAGCKAQMIDWALDQFSEGAIWALVVLGVIAVVVGVIEAARFLKK